MIIINLEQAISYGKEYLKGLNYDHELIYMLMDMLKITKNTILLDKKNIYLDDNLQKVYKDYLIRKKNHEPLAYLLNNEYFMGFEFYVDNNVLIPRWETELLVEKIIEYTYNKVALNVLDMCTGSGCIIISLLKLTNSINEAYGVDISNDALEIAKKNAKNHNVFVNLLESDMFTNLTSSKKFDIIISNPPYITTKALQTLDKSVVKYEPTLALDGKDSGLFFYETIAKNAGNYLKDNGVIFLEIGYDQGDKIKRLFKDYKSVTISKDYSNLDRIAKIEYF